MWTTRRHYCNVFYFTWTILHCNDIKSGTSGHVALGFGQRNMGEVSAAQGSPPPTSNNFSDLGHLFCRTQNHWWREQKKKKCLVRFQTTSRPPEDWWIETRPKGPISRLRCSSLARGPNLDPGSFYAEEGPFQAWENPTPGLTEPTLDFTGPIKGPKWQISCLSGCILGLYWNQEHDPPSHHTYILANILVISR